MMRKSLETCPDMPLVLDFKIPAEHRIYGEEFDAEMQIFHLHPGRRRIPAISVLIRVDPNSYNDYLQTAIDAFQYSSFSSRSEFRLFKKDLIIKKRLFELTLLKITGIEISSKLVSKCGYSLVIPSLIKFILKLFEFCIKLSSKSAFS